MTLTAPERTVPIIVPETKVCTRCQCVLRKPARNCGMCEAEILEATVRDLTAPKLASTLAIWELRDRGLTSRQVLCIRREVLRGRKPYEVVKAIEGLSSWRAAG